MCFFHSWFEGFARSTGRSVFRTARISSSFMRSRVLYSTSVERMSNPADQMKRTRSFGCSSLTSLPTAWTIPVREISI